MTRINPFARARQELADVLRGRTTAHGDLRDRVLVIAAVTVVVDAVCAVLTYLLERHVPGTAIRGFGDAAFFSTTQLLSVSSSLPNPLSTGGRVLDVAMEVYAITVVAALAGSAGAFLHRRSMERHDA